MSIGVEYIQLTTENDHLSKAVSKLTLEELSKLTHEELIEMGKAKKRRFCKNKEMK